MATSQQGKKKKKVLSQQQIDKLLVMLKEEDKPLRAGILAKTLGYQSAKDINATLLRLEGYGMVTRIMMNNTPLWKFSGREAPQLSAPSEEASGEMRDGNILLGGSTGTVILPRPPVIENGNITQSTEESLPSRPQSIKADLEWDPTDIQDVTSNGQQLAEFHSCPSSNSTPYTSSNSNAGLASMPGSAITKTQTCDVPPSPASTFSSVAETTSSLTFTNNREYSGQDLYVSVNSLQERTMSGANLNVNNIGVKTPAMSNYPNTDYSAMSGYSQPSAVNLGPMGNVLNTSVPGGMQPNYNMDFNQPARSSGNTSSNSSDLYMLTNTGMGGLSSAIAGGSGAPNLQHAFPANHSQTPHEFTGSSTYTTSVNCATMAPKTGSSVAPNLGLGGFGRDGASQAHAVSHYSQSSYNTNTSSVPRSNAVVPTYVVQEIMKPEGVGQYGLTGHQQEGTGLPGYQTVHPHPHQHHHHHHHQMDGSQVMSFSQQPYPHNNSTMNSAAAPPSQLQQHPHHHHHHQQQHRQPMASQHHHPHHHQPQQQPLAQAANFVNVGTFTGGNYNQFQGNFNMGTTSNRNYSSQHQGTATYNSGNVNSKDFSSYAGAGAGFRSSHNTTIKRQHFSGYTPSGLFPGLRPHMYNQIGQIRPPFPGNAGFTRPNKSNRGTSYSRAGSSQNPGGRGHRYQNGRVGGELEPKGKQQSTSSSGKGSPKSEVNKYMGTEVLDDICRRLAQQANTQSKHTDPDTDNAGGSQKDKGQLAKSDDLSGVKLKQDSDNQTKKVDKVKKAQDMPRENIPDAASKMTNSRENGAISRHNGYRNYNGRHQQYQNRGGYYGRDNTRHNNHYRNGPRHPDPNRQIGGRTLESGRYPKPSPGQVPDLKNTISAAPSANGKTGSSKDEKDVTDQASKDRSDQRSKDGEETPLIRLSNLLADHLDPNNVLLSHLFVKGLIGRVLVDQVRLMKTRRDAMERLMPVLLKMPKSAVLTGFSDALTKSGQGYLAEIIKGTGIESEEMTSQHTSLLELHRQNIAASMIPDKDLLVSLRTQSILTPDLHKFVSSQPSRAQQIDSLLHILPFRGDKAFEIFRGALRKSGQPWLAEQITMENS